MRLKEIIKAQTILGMFKHPEAASLNLQVCLDDQVQWQKMTVIIIVHDVELAFIWWLPQLKYFYRGSSHSRFRNIMIFSKHRVMDLVADNRAVGMALSEPAVQLVLIDICLLLPLPSKIY